MKKTLPFLLISFLSFCAQAQIGNVGINTTTPLAMLHVKDSNVLFTGGPFILPIVAADPPVSGGGTRMMWYPDKAAFRIGNVDGTQWDKVNIGASSFASGINTTASNLGSTAMGDNTKALANSSTAMGENSRASGVASTAMGLGTVASGLASMSMGASTTASGDFSIATGIRTTAAAFSSICLGRFNDSIITSSKTVWVPTDPIFIIGNGTSNSARSNAIVIYKNGNLDINGNLSTIRARLLRQ